MKETDFFEGMDILKDIKEKDDFGIEKKLYSACEECHWPNLYEVSGLLNSFTFNYKKTLTTIVDIAIEITNADRGFLLLFDKDKTLKVQVARNKREENLEEDRFELSRTIIDNVIDKQEPIHIPNLGVDPEFGSADSIIDLHLLSVMCVPLKVRAMEDVPSLHLPSENDIIGLIYVDSSSVTEFFAGKSLEVFQSLANHATTALINSKLFAHFIEEQRIKGSLEIAQDVHDRFLPEKAPEVEGYDIFGWSISCEETGGDYYDFIRLKDGRIGLAIGDVSGHGIGPALVMATARAFLKALIRGGRDISDVFFHLNNLLNEDTDDNMFMTLFLAILDPKKRSLSYLNGGQDYPILYRNKKFVDLKQSSSALGAFPDIKFPKAVTYKLKKNDILTLFTDGIIETLGKGSRTLGSKRFKNIIKKNCKKNGEEITQKVHKELKKWSKKKGQEDDWTMTIVKVN